MRQKLSPEDEFNMNMDEVVKVLLKEGKISNSAVQKVIEVGFDKANEYMDKLEEYGLILPLGSKRGARKLIPNSISSEVREILSKYGYNKDEIEVKQNEE